MSERKRVAPPGASAHYKRWTDAEEKRLRLDWGELSLETISRSLGRSQLTVYWRARQIGLPCGVSQGLEYLTAAARRTGFTTGELRALLTKAHIKLRPAMARPRPNASRVYHVVCPDDVDRAVALWGDTELVYPAGVARGLGGDTLRRWLIAAGHKPPQGKKARWRVKTSVIDQVVAAARAVASVRAHAERVGLSRGTLANRLRAVGVLGPKRPGVEVRLPAAVVDAALRKVA